MDAQRIQDPQSRPPWSLPFAAALALLLTVAPDTLAQDAVSPDDLPTQCTQQY